MAKQVIFGEEVRKRLKNGVDVAANAVRATIGPRGRNVALDKGFGGPTITNDGVSVAKEISFKDKFENMGAEMVKEVASKTNESVGDGTTTSVVLFQSMVEEGMKRLALGLNPVLFRHGMEAAAVSGVALLKKMAKPIKTKEEIRQVATISAESEDIGDKVAETVDKVGKDGVVTVEESQAMGVETDIVEGLEFDKGYVSAYLITNAERMEAEYRDVHVLITDKKISTVQGEGGVLPVLEKVAQSGKKELIIIADDVDGEALTTFIVNKLRGAFSVLAVKAPGYGERKKEQLQDIATVLGGTVISEETGHKLDSTTLDMLGRADRVVATKDKTTIVGGKGKKSDIDARVTQLRKQREQTDSKYDKEKIDERIGKLSGGVAVIRVGAPTETEMKYLKLKIEDAVNATKAAMDEGVVPGGGTALLRLSKGLLDQDSYKKSTDAEYRAGYATVSNAVLAPITAIIDNATGDVGLENMTIISRIVHQELETEKGIERAKEHVGFDAKKKAIVPDMIKAGIIDPVKVVRMALENAVSAAAILLTTEVAIAEEPEDKKPTGPDMGGMEGMGGMGL